MFGHSSFCLPLASISHVKSPPLHSVLNLSRDMWVYEQRLNSYCELRKINNTISPLTSLADSLSCELSALPHLALMSYKPPVAVKSVLWQRGRLLFDKHSVQELSCLERWSSFCDLAKRWLIFVIWKLPIFVLEAETLSQYQWKGLNAFSMHVILTSGLLECIHTCPLYSALIKL